MSLLDIANRMFALHRALDRFDGEFESAEPLAAEALQCAQLLLARAISPYATFDFIEAADSPTEFSQISAIERWLETGKATLLWFDVTVQISVLLLLRINATGSKVAPALRDILESGKSSLIYFPQLKLAVAK